jgi:hypothetical protein
MLSIRTNPPLHSSGLLFPTLSSLVYFFQLRQTLTAPAAFLRRTPVGEWPIFVAPMCATLLEKAVE